MKEILLNCRDESGNTTLQLFESEDHVDIMSMNISTCVMKEDNAYYSHDDDDGHDTSVSYTLISSSKSVEIINNFRHVTDLDRRLYNECKRMYEGDIVYYADHISPIISSGITGENIYITANNNGWYECVVDHGTYETTTYISIDDVCMS